MRILILGANGQLGSDLCRACRIRDAEFSAIGLYRKDIDVSDLSQIKPVLERHDFDALVNCTSNHKTDEVERNATLAFTINAHAVKAIAEACA
ncbi:MAG: sugar nucleotide-binding protein, partial [Phycisphaerae bacterium]|nr:sugar nucleotide-binding protein [Phycisphaerae bacterium]